MDRRRCEVVEYVRIAVVSAERQGDIEALLTLSPVVLLQEEAACWSEAEPDSRRGRACFGRNGDGSNVLRRLR